MPTVTSYIDKQHNVTGAGYPAAYGNSKDNHAPIGHNSSTGWRYRELMHFPANFTVIPAGARLVKATLRMKTTSAVHLGFSGTSPTIEIRRLGEAFAATGGSGETWQDSANPKGFTQIGTDGGVLTFSHGAAENDVHDFDITGIFEEFMNPAAYKPSGIPSGGYSNYGIEIRAGNESANSDHTEYWSMRGSYPPRVIVEYTTEADPAFPDVISPQGELGSAPTHFVFSIPAGDTATQYDINVGTALDAIDVWDTPNTNLPAGGSPYSIPYGGPALTPGVQYYWRVRTLNSLGVVSGWDAGSRGQFLIAPAPTVAFDHPPASGRAHIHNLGLGGKWADTAIAKPRVKVLYGHATPTTKSELFEVKVNGGAVQEFPISVDPGTVVPLDIDTPVARNTDFTVEVRAKGTGGLYSTWASRTMRVNWAQGIYRFPHAAGATAFTTNHATLTGGVGTQAAYLYKDAATSDWKDTITAVPPGVQMDMLIRLSTSEVAQNPALPYAQIEWSEAPPIYPDFWAANNAAINQDSGFRRFGIHSLHVVPTAAGWLRNTIGSRVSVSTEYTLSAFVHTGGKVLTQPLSLALFKENGVDLIEPYEGDDRSTTDSVGGSEGWQRLFATFKVPSDTTIVKPALLYGTGAVKEFWCDAFQFEEGTVATGWKPGLAGPAVVVDVGGIAVDGEAGGIFRLRTSDGTLIEMRADALYHDGVPLIPGGGGGAEGGAPTDASYLVASSHVELSNEIAVGSAPGGELGGTWAAPTVDSVHSGSAHHARGHLVGSALDHTDVAFEQGVLDGEVMTFFATGMPVDVGAYSGPAPVATGTGFLSSTTPTNARDGAPFIVGVAASWTFEYATPQLFGGATWTPTDTTKELVGLSIDASPDGVTWYPAYAAETGLNTGAPVSIVFTDTTLKYPFWRATVFAIEGADARLQGWAYRAYSQPGVWKPLDLAREELDAHQAEIDSHHSEAHELLEHLTRPHYDLTDILPDDHHAQAHALDGPDHTGTLPAHAMASHSDNTFDGHLLPDTSLVYDIGSVASRWRDLYLGYDSDSAGQMPEIFLYKARLGAAKVELSDILGLVGWRAWDGAAFHSVASIRAIVEWATAAGSLGTALQFYTTAEGSVTQTERWRIRADGILRPAGNNLYDIGLNSQRVRSIFGHTLDLATGLTLATASPSWAATPSTQAFADAAAAGAATTFARGDHKHGMPAAPATHTQAHDHSAAADGQALAPTSIVVSGDTDISGGLKLSGLQSHILTANNEVITLAADTNYLDITAGGFSIAGLVGGTIGRTLLIHLAPGGIDFLYESALVPATQRFQTPGLRDWNAPGRTLVWAYYGGSRWFLQGQTWADTFSTQAFGDGGTAGVSTDMAREDHKHAMPANPVTAHEAAADPHTGYQKESEKGAANGYASLDSGILVPTAQMATGTPDGSKFLRDDRTWQTPAGGGGGAPINAQYLVAVADASLSAEVVVGATPGGELGGTWAAPTVDATHAGGTHHAQAHVITGADHTASGLTAGHVMRASGATAFGFAAIQDADVPATIARDSEVAAAVTAHEGLADPHTGYLTPAEGAAAYSPLAHAHTPVVPDIQRFTSGSGNWTKPAGALFCHIIVVGGGGASGSNPSTGAGLAACSGGGGGGGYAEATVAASALSGTVAYAVGAAGAKAAAGANPGGAGGNSSFGAYLTANGGGGGVQGAATSGSNSQDGGAGGAVGGTLIQKSVPGAAGMAGEVAGGTRIYIGNGGGTPLGPSVPCTTGAGRDATGYGAGGGGCTASPSTSAHQGGNGAPGLVIVETYFQ